MIRNENQVVERVNGDGRSIMLDEYQVDSHIIWAGFSSNTQTVFLSNVT